MHGDDYSIRSFLDNVIQEKHWRHKMYQIFIYEWYWRSKYTLGESRRWTWTKMRVYENGSGDIGMCNGLSPFTVVSKGMNGINSSTPSDRPNNQLLITMCCFYLYHKLTSHCPFQDDYILITHWKVYACPKSEEKNMNWDPMHRFSFPIWHINK